MAFRPMSGLLLILTAIELVALTLFTKGLFPSKTYMPARKTLVDDVPDWRGRPPLTACETLRNGQYKPSSKHSLLDACFGLQPQFDRLVFMVIDSLR